jgi:hypothetical protein
MTSKKFLGVKMDKSGGSMSARKNKRIEILQKILSDESINWWIKLSIEYANQRSYLDDLFSIYPTIPEGIRDIDHDLWQKVEFFFQNKDDLNLLKTLLKFKKFPIKDSYVAYLRHDPSALDRNPKTVRRLASRIYELGLSELYKLCSEPKETNRQLGPMFKRWLEKGYLGFPLLNVEGFRETTEDAILIASDEEMKQYAREYLGYNRDKGLDFIARVNRKYVIGETKFLTDFGGHQNAQLEDAKQTLLASVKEGVIKIAILDGVLYIPGNNKMFRSITQEDLKNKNILSALILREFLYAI